MRILARVVLSLGLVAMGMAGLYFKVEYSGWIVFVGCLVAVA